MCDSKFPYFSHCAALLKDFSDIAQTFGKVVHYLPKIGRNEHNLNGVIGTDVFALLPTFLYGQKCLCIFLTQFLPETEKDN